SVSAIAAAALVGDPNHIVKGPTWPMTSVLNAPTSGINNITDYLTQYGLCKPTPFYSYAPLGQGGTTTFQNLISLAAAQGCSFTQQQSQSRGDCSNITQHDDFTPLHSQLIGWHDEQDGDN